MLQSTDHTIDATSTRGDTRFETLHRYHSVLALAEGRRVLDVGFGDGVGAALLATRASSVVAVDNVPELVARARQACSATNLDFRLGSIHRLPLPDSSIDLIVCFQTLEFVGEHEEALAELSRVLTPDGVAVFSTPDKYAFSDARNFREPAHVTELHAHEFEALLRRHFPSVNLYAQRSVHASMMAPLGNAAGSVRSFSHEGSTGVVRSGDTLIDPMFLVAVVSRTAAPELPLSRFESSPNGFEAERHRLVAELAAMTRKLADAVASEHKAKRALAEAFRSRLSLEHELKSLREYGVVLRAEVNRLSQSTSWKITAPIRSAGNVMKWMVGVSHLTGLESQIERARQVVHAGHRMLYSE